MDIKVLHVSSNERHNKNDLHTNFKFDLKDEIKDVVHIRLSSIELPNVSYLFDYELYDNTRFFLVYSGIEYEIIIPDGNYTSSQMIDKINELLSSESLPITLELETSSGICIFSGSSDYYLRFSKTKNSSLGTHLGFNNIEYENELGDYEYKSESILNVLGSHIYFLELNNWGKVVTKFSNNIFAKIISYTDKYTIIFNDSSNLVTKDEFFEQPININKLYIKLYHEDGSIVNLRGLSFSFTLEVSYINNGYLKNDVIKNILFKENKGEKLGEYIQFLKIKKLLN
jgi:hypothetical protein